MPQNICWPGAFSSIFIQEVLFPCYLQNTPSGPKEDTEDRDLRFVLGVLKERPLEQVRAVSLSDPKDEKLMSRW